MDARGACLDAPLQPSAVRGRDLQVTAVTPNRAGWWMCLFAGIGLGVGLLKTDSVTPLNLVIGSIVLLVLVELAQYLVRRKLRKKAPFV